MIVLFLTVLLDFVGFGIIIPMLPFFGSQFGASDTQIGFLFAIYSAVQFFSGPLWGRLSDRIGRRPVLLMTLSGAALAYVIFGFADSLAMLFVARGLSGLMAGNMGVAHAIVADLTSPEDRARGMGILGAATALGFVFGPLLGGQLVPADPAMFDHAIPAFTAAALSGGAFVVGLIMLKESLPSGIGRGKSPVEQQATRSLGMLATYPSVIGLVLIMAVLSYVISQLVAVFPLLAKFQFGWGPRELSHLFALVGLAVAVIQGGVVGIATRWLGENRVLLTGAVIEAGGLIGVVVAQSQAGVVSAFIVTFIGGTLCTPIITSMISQATAPEHQGAMLGTANSVASLGRIVGPPAGGAIYQFVGHGAPFALAAAMVSGIAVRSLRAIMATRGDRKATRGDRKATRGDRKARP